MPLWALVCGDPVIAKRSEKTPLVQLIASDDAVIISASDSVPIGKAVASDMSKRLGKTILALCGHDAVIVVPSVELKDAPLPEF